MPELWIISEPCWSFPLELTRLEGQDVVGVCPCDIPLLAIQRATITAKLDSIANFNEGRWWLIEQVLRKHALRVDGDPESFVTWSPMETRIEFAPKESAERAEFFKLYALEGVLRDPVHVEIVFNSLCKFMLHWMLNRQRSVDLGFCELSPVPYRPNWFQIILEKDLQLAEQVKLNGKHPVLNANLSSLIKRKVPEHMLDSTLLYWCEKDRHVYWSITARPKSLWWKMVKAVERAKKARQRGGYLGGVGDTMKRMLPQSLRLYASFLQQVRLPYVRLGSYQPGSFTQRTPEQRAIDGTVEKSDPPVDLPVSIGTASDPEPSTVLDDVQEASIVSALSDLQQGKVDLRHGGETVPEPQHR